MIDEVKKKAFKMQSLFFMHLSSVIAFSSNLTFSILDSKKSSGLLLLDVLTLVLIILWRWGIIPPLQQIQATSLCNSEYKVAKLLIFSMVQNV